MTANEIRAKHYCQYENHDDISTAFWLREIAAQLADLNEHLRVAFSPTFEARQKAEPRFRSHEQMTRWYKRVHEIPSWGWEHDPLLEGITREQFEYLRNAETLPTQEKFDKR